MFLDPIYGAVRLDDLDIDWWRPARLALYTGNCWIGHVLIMTWQSYFDVGVEIPKTSRLHCFVSAANSLRSPNRVRDAWTVEAGGWASSCFVRESARGPNTAGMGKEQHTREHKIYVEISYHRSVAIVTTQCMFEIPRAKHCVMQHGLRSCRIVSEVEATDIQSGFVPDHSAADSCIKKSFVITSSSQEKNMVTVR